ncbi:protein Ocr [Klebsiella phage vB_KpnP_23]
MERNANAYYDLLAATVELFNERIQQDELTEDTDWPDALHEVVDGQVPHYYHEIFTVMAADGICHEFDDSGLIPDTKDVSRICQARIYEALYNDVLNDSGIVWYEEDEEDCDD